MNLLLPRQESHRIGNVSATSVDRDMVTDCHGVRSNQPPTSGCPMSILQPTPSPYCDLPCDVPPPELYNAIVDI